MDRPAPLPDPILEASWAVRPRRGAERQVAIASRRWTADELGAAAERLSDRVAEQALPPVAEAEVRARPAEHKESRCVVRLDELPRNARGKLGREALLALAE